MDRRSFLKASVVVPFYFSKIVKAGESAQTKFIKSTQKSFDYLEVRGSYEQIGFQIGKYFGKNMKEIIQQRSEWHSQLINILNTKKGRLVSKELLRITQKHFPHILQEVKGTADGAGISFDYIWAMAIKSELLGLENDPDGCSSIFFRDKNNIWLFHNEDGHSAYKNLMFALKVIPPSGVSFISLVYPGIIPGNGPSLNNRGIIQATNYIGSSKSEIGIPRYVIGRAILEAKSAQEAIDIATMQPRSYPYHHHIGNMNDQTYFSVETTPGLSQVKEPEGLYFHTNHLLFEQTKNYKYEDEDYKNTSSISRYKAIKDELKDLDISRAKAEDFLKILSSHQNAPYSPCRHPKDEVQGLTLGTAFFDLKKGCFRLYKGNPCKAVKNNLYFDFKF
jgi:predicted choloylglycine hydrolase